MDPKTKAFNAKTLGWTQMHRMITRLMTLFNHKILYNMRLLITPATSMSKYSQIQALCIGLMTIEDQLRPTWPRMPPIRMWTTRPSTMENFRITHQWPIVSAPLINPCRIYSKRNLLRDRRCSMLFHPLCFRIRARTKGLSASSHTSSQPRIQGSPTSHKFQSTPHISVWMSSNW